MLSLSWLSESYADQWSASQMLTGDEYMGSSKKQSFSLSIFVRINYSLRSNAACLPCASRWVRQSSPVGTGWLTLPQTVVNALKGRPLSPRFRKCGSSSSLSTGMQVKVVIFACGGWLTLPLRVVNTLKGSPLVPTTCLYRSCALHSGR